MRDYTKIDWDQPVPTYDALRVSYAQSSIRVRPLDRRLQRIIDLFHEERTSARMAAAQFDLDLDDAYRFFLQRNRLNETGFFYDLFRGLAFLEAIPDVGAMRWSPLTLNNTYEGRVIGQAQGLKLVSGWDAFAVLANWLRIGGLFIEPDQKLNDRQTLRLTRGVAGAAFSGEMSAGSCYSGHAPWSDWFDAESFDTTLVFIDHLTGVATVLMLTDSP